MPLHPRRDEPAHPRTLGEIYSKMTKASVTASALTAKASIATEIEFIG
jgi:hypothetical protein